MENVKQITTIICLTALALLLTHPEFVNGNGTDSKTVSAQPSEQPSETVVQTGELKPTDEASNKCVDDGYNNVCIHPSKSRWDVQRQAAETEAPNSQWDLSGYTPEEQLRIRDYYAAKQAQPAKATPTTEAPRMRSEAKPKECGLLEWGCMIDKNVGTL